MDVYYNTGAQPTAIAFKLEFTDTTDIISEILQEGTSLTIL